MENTELVIMVSDRKGRIEMKIVFVSDYVCPYCLVAKEAMLRALKERKLEPEITWQPFELTVEPKPRVDTYHDEERKAHYQVLKEPCRQMGLDMKLPPAVVPRPYTRLAFEGYFYAEEQGKGETYNDLMYKAYFIDEKDIGDLEVLCSLAGTAGLDVEEYRRVLEQGVYREKMKEANRYAREDLHVTHVPTIYVDGTEITVEKYTVEEFLDIFRKISEQGTKEQEPQNDTAETEDHSGHAGGCGPNGCSIF